MKFTTTVAMIDPEFYVPLARAAEEVGFDSVAVPDSIAYPRTSSSRYPYNFDGTREFLENKPFLEPFAAIAAMAAVTERIEFHTFVLKMPMRHPVVLAKEATSLAVLTGSRFVLGVGSSPWPDDYEIVGLPWERRGRRFDECIDVVRGLSAGGYFEFHGEFYDFPAIKLNPVPDRPLPIMIGGHSDANLRRAARSCDGWMAAGGSQEEITEWVTRLQHLRDEYGTTREPFDVYATSVDSFSADGVKRLEELGVTYTSGGFGRFNPYGVEADPETLQEKIDNLRRYADDVIAPVRG
ncbi:MAG TPA: TIGR03619 family F420-dependent LLM class oxidoreductase [Acidimicrobiia bacterium]|nr:TIGR03619 family F420-dependent LLM class oxidoreductase [Acidimicrobiia bacterium]